MMVISAAQVVSSATDRQPLVTRMRSGATYHSRRFQLFDTPADQWQYAVTRGFVISDLLEPCDYATLSLGTMVASFSSPLA